MSSTAPTLTPPPTAVDDTHKVYSIAIGCGVMCGVTTLVVFARLLFRWKSDTLGLDDYAFIPAILFYWGWSIMAVYVNLHAGVGKPLWEITLGEYSVWFQGIIGSMWLYPAMSFWIRVSILLFYRRLFSTPGSRFKTVIHVLLVMQVVYLIVFSILPAFVGHPLHKLWDPLERNQHMNNYYYAYTHFALYATSMVFDAILLFLPTWPLWKLQMPLRRRLSIAVVFMMGSAATVVAAWKLAINVIEFYRFTRIDPRWITYEMSRLIPPQFDTYGVTFWISSQLEPTVALIGASMPALRHAFAVTAPQISRFWMSLRSGSSQHTEKYDSLKVQAYQNFHNPDNNQTPAETEDTARILGSHQPSDHPIRPYIRLQEWRI